MKSKKSNFLLGNGAVDRATNPFDKISITTLFTAFTFHTFYKVPRIDIHCFFMRFEAAVSIEASKLSRRFLKKKINFVLENSNFEKREVEMR